MPERDRTAPGIYTRVVVGKAKMAQDGQALGGKRLVDFDDIHLREIELQSRQQLLRGRHRTDAHDAWRYTGNCQAEHPCARSEPESRGRRLVGQQQRAGAVVDAAGVSRGDGSARPDDRSQLREGFQRRRARMLVPLDDQRRALALRYMHRDDFAREEPCCLRVERPVLARECESVLRFPLDAELSGQRLGRLRHRVDAVA